MRDRTIFAHTVLEFGGCRWVGRQPPCVREDRKMESKGGVYLALDFIIRYPSNRVFAHLGLLGLKLGRLLS